MSHPSKSSWLVVKLIRIVGDLSIPFWQYQAQAIISMYYSLMLLEDNVPFLGGDFCMIRVDY